MALLRHSDPARGGLRAGLRLAAIGAGLAAPVVLTAGLVTDSARAGVRAARTLAESATRAVGTVVTGADPLPDGHVHSLVDTARAMVEPPTARQTPRVWADRGHVQVELGGPGAGSAELRRSLRRALEKLDGVSWATVNAVAGRVLVAVDERRVGIADVVGVVTAVEQARGARRLYPLRSDHPADLEPVLAALVTAAVDTAAVGVAFAGRYLPVPKLHRHATLAVALLDSQEWIKTRLADRIGPVGTDLVFTGTSALLHALTQSPTVPALNAVAAVQEALEMRTRRQVWRRREHELCGPELEQPDDEVPPPGPRPAPLPDGAIERYRARLGPPELLGALALLPLPRRPGRSADLMKALTPKAAVAGRESFAATLDLLLSRRGVLPMDGAAYRRLDRVDTVVVDGEALCTGPPVVLDAQADADGWDVADVWSAATRLLGGESPGGRLGLGPARRVPDAPGGEQRTLLEGRRRVGVVTVAPELDPHAEALLAAAAGAGARVVLTAHVGTREVAGMADEVTEEPLLETVRTLQGEGRGVLLVSAADGPALLAADVAVAPVRPGRAPAWGADLVTCPGLADSCLLVAAIADARAVSRRSVESAVTGNVLGSLLAAVGSARYGQAKATAPGKSATAFTMLSGTWTAARVAARPTPPVTVHTPWHALDAEEVRRRLADRPADREPPPSRMPAPVRRLGATPQLRLPLRYARTVAAELADPLTPVLGTGAAATAMLGEATDA